MNTMNHRDLNVYTMEKMTNRKGGCCPPQSLKRSVIAKLITTKNFIVFLVRNAKEKSR